MKSLQIIIEVKKFNQTSVSFSSINNVPFFILRGVNEMLKFEINIILWNVKMKGKTN